MRSNANQGITGRTVGFLEQGALPQANAEGSQCEQQPRPVADSKARDRNTRSLKIEASGDPWRGRIKPQIRLAGNWLERAGFKPGHRVEVCLDGPGMMTLCFREEIQQA